MHDNEEKEKGKKKKESFWTTLPGILTGCAAIIGAIGTLITALNTAGLLSPHSTPTVSIPSTLAIENPTAVASTETFVPESTNTPTIAGVTANLEFPQHRTAVGKSVIVRGTITELGSGQRAFLCVKSQAFSRLIFPQGEILPDSSGQWTVESIYRDVGYSYETFVVVTDNSRSAEMLADQYYRSNGMSSLPQDTIIISQIVVVTRE